jgi:hypothetical protein
MPKFYNLARMSVSGTPGTGTITLGSAVSGHLTFAAAGVADGEVVAYGIRDGANSEIGFGVYTAAGTTLTRNVSSSTNANAPISCTSAAEVYITIRAQDVMQQGLSPGGRLTLTSNTPVMIADALAQTTVYYTPYRGSYVPLYDGQSFVPVDFAQLSQLTTDTTKSPAAALPDSCYDIFVWNDAGTLRATRGPNWTKSATVTMTIANPCVVTWAAHGLAEGDPVVFTNSGGALPTGITAGTTYYVSRSPAAGTFSFSTSLANAASNTRVTTSGTQSGTHTATNRTRLRGTGAGTTELTLVKGLYVNTNAITNGPAAQRGTYVGTIRTNASSQVDWDFGELSLTSVKFNVWNAFNRVMMVGYVFDGSGSYTYTSNANRAAHGSIEMQARFVVGLREDTILVSLTNDHATVAVQGAICFGFIGFNCTDGANPSGMGIKLANQLFTSAPTSTGIATVPNCTGRWLPAPGAYYVTALESSDNTNANSFNTNGDSSLAIQMMA